MKNSNIGIQEISKQILKTNLSNISFKPKTLKLSQLKAYKTGNYEYLYIYFKAGGKSIKINTGYKPNDIKDASINNFIKGMQSKVDMYILTCRNENKKIDNRDCSNYLNLDYPEIKVKEQKEITNNDILVHLNNFVDQKILELNYINSSKIYPVLKNNLIEFNKQYKLTPESINDINFLYKFRDFGYNTKNLVDNTLSKRISLVKSFLKYLDTNEIVKIKTILFQYKIPKRQSEIVSLTRDEILTIYNQKYNKDEQILIDIFIFLTLTGLRYGDYFKLQKNDIINNVLEKSNEKTKTDIKVKLNQTAINILQKYNNEIPKYSNAYLNRRLKEILLKYDLLNYEIKKTIYINRIPINKTYIKRDLISIHKSRSTFITNLISNNLPFNDIMTATGQKRVSTLAIYANKQYNPSLTDCLEL
jgi:integrase